LVSAKNHNPWKGKELTPGGEDNTDSGDRAISTFRPGTAGELLGGDLYGQTRQAWKRFWDQQSLRERDSYMQTGWHDRVDPVQRRDYRNGFYERD
jgi:hypothetical protein